MKKKLIIGYGNSLRSDDGAGQKVAEAFLDDDEIEAIATHQLTPELAETIAQCEQVYFVDAAPIKTLKIKAITAHEKSAEFGHFVDPKTLLSLVKTLYHQSPQAYLILIPAIDFELGETFSPITQRGIVEATQFLHNLDNLNNHNKRTTPCMK